MLSQMAVDPFRRFIHIQFGIPSSFNDWSIFNESELYRYEHNFFSNGEYLLTDGRYPGDGHLDILFNQNDVHKAAGRAALNAAQRSVQVVVE